MVLKAFSRPPSLGPRLHAGTARRPGLSSQERSPLIGLFAPVLYLLLPTLLYLKSAWRKMLCFLSAQIRHRKPAAWKSIRSFSAELGFMVLEHIGAEHQRHWKRHVWMCSTVQRRFTSVLMVHVISIVTVQPAPMSQVPGLFLR